jgi:hypothetical protein
MLPEMRGRFMVESDRIRLRVHQLRRAVPFRKFVINLENGKRVRIEHPANIAFDPEPKSRNRDFAVVARKVTLFSTFDAVTRVFLADRG